MSSPPSPPDPPELEPRRPVTAVVFDLGGVLLDWDPRHLYRQMFTDPLQMEHFLAEVCTMQWHDAHDRGRPLLEGCRELSAAHPGYSEAIMAWAQRSEEMIAGPIDGTVALLAQLRRRGVPCYALTNMEAETYPLRRERFAFMRWFDGTVVSSHEGVAKPDHEIFRRLLERYHLVAAETVFVDDAPRNVVAAREVGLQAHHFRDPDELRAWLEAAGLLEAERAHTSAIPAPVPPTS